MNDLTAWDALTRPDYLYPLIAGMALAAACALVSVLVVLKRLAFIGQGISHAGFGGVGLASFLALSGFSRDFVILLFCVVTAIVIARLSRTRQVMIDTAIGIMLVAAMGLGFLLDQLRLTLTYSDWYTSMVGGRNIGLAATPWETVLFGSILYVQVDDMIVALILSAVVTLILAALFKEVVFYAFDETVSRVFGIPSAALHYLVLVLIAALIVVAMKLAGLILVNALLVVPGATATLLSRRLWPVLILSVIVGEVGMVVGYLLSFQIMGGSLPTGPFIVLTLAAQFGIALLISRLRRH